MGSDTLFNEDEIERLAREMTMVGAVDPGVSESTLEEFHNTLVANEFITKGDMNCARPVLIA
mgnify:CR=1 FL=1